MYNLYHFLQKYFLKQRGILQTKDCKGFGESGHNKILWKKVGVFLEGTKRGKKPFPFLARVLAISFSGKRFRGQEHQGCCLCCMLHEGLQFVLYYNDKYLHGSERFPHITLPSMHHTSLWTKEVDFTDLMIDLVA